MDEWPKYILQLLDILIWPGVIFMALFLFRDPINRFIDRIKHLEGGGVSLSLDERLLELNRIARTVQYSTDGDKLASAVSDHTQRDKHHFLYSTGIGPYMQKKYKNIMDGWTALEIAIRSFASRHDVQDESTLSILDKLHQKELLDSDVYELLHEMWDIRSQVFHGYITSSDLTDKHSKLYLNSAKRIAEKLERV